MAAVHNVHWHPFDLTSEIETLLLVCACVCMCVCSSQEEEGVGTVVVTSH